MPHRGGIGDPTQGFYAGLPGELYSKILKEEWTEQAPAASYWNLTRLVSDNRIAALERRDQQFRFQTNASRFASVEIKLLFRRAPMELAQQKSWPVTDIVMARQRHLLKLPRIDGSGPIREPGESP